MEEKGLALPDAKSVELYLKSYIESYMEGASARKVEEAAVPPFVKGYPFHVRASILPNGSVVALFYFNSREIRIEVGKESFEAVRARLQKREHSHMLGLPPLKAFTEEDGRRDAEIALSSDLRLGAYRAGLETVRSSLESVVSEIRDIARTNPWLERQLLGVVDKLSTTREPLEKLREELRRMEEEERYSDHEFLLTELQKYRTTGEAPMAEVTEKTLEKYLTAYIAAYRDTIKPDYPEAARPAFYRGHPHHVRAFILPNGAVAVTFKYNSPQPKIEVSRASPDLVADLLKSREHHNFIGLPPLRSYRKEDATYDAKLAVKRDMKIALLRALLEATRAQTGEEEKNLLEISKTNPWLEKQLTQTAARLSGVKELLATLADELEKSESGRRYGEHEQLLDVLRRYRSPEELAAVAEEAAGEAPQPAGIPIYDPTAGAGAVPIYRPGGAAERPSEAGVGAPTQVRYEMAPEDRQALDMIKATLYNIDVKLDDFERRLNYMDKYIEGVQKQQLEKFNAQEEILRYEARRAKYAGIGISATALVLLLIFLLDSWLRILDPLRRLIFGG
ncbi:MAG: hypothetical protein QXH42_01235 [Thermoplasmata archaeon]